MLQIIKPASLCFPLKTFPVGAFKDSTTPEVLADEHQYFLHGVIFSLRVLSSDNLSSFCISVLEHNTVKTLLSFYL